MRELIRHIIHENYRQRTFDEIKKMSIDDLLELKKDLIEYNKVGWEKYFTCFAKILKSFDKDLILNLTHYDFFLDKYKPFFDEQQVINLKVSVYFEYDFKNSNSDVKWNNIFREYYSPNADTHKKLNSCFRQSIQNNEKHYQLSRTFPKTQIPFPSVKFIPSDSFLNKQSESDLYRQYKKYISKKDDYPGDENAISFLDDLLRIKGSKPDSESSGERLVRLFLEKNKVKFKQYHRIKKCFSELNGRCYTLPFDFYLPETNTLIEYDGEQHFKPIDIWGGEKGFQRQQLLDSIKNKFCADNNIKLIRIPFNVKTEEKLMNYLTHEILQQM